MNEIYPETANERKSVISSTTPTQTNSNKSTNENPLKLNSAVLQDFGEGTSPDPIEVKECDYDMNPTLLYKFIEYKEWGEAMERCKYAPHEASTWVVRYEEELESSSTYCNETSKTLRWRMLPIHVAVLFNAPLKLVTAIQKAYPPGAASVDDRKMLPIHLCCRVLSNLNVATFLICNNASTLNKTDYRGRTPLRILMDYKEKNLTKTGGSGKGEAKNRDILIKLIEDKMSAMRESKISFVKGSEIPQKKDPSLCSTTKKILIEKNIMTTEPTSETKVSAISNNKSKSEDTNLKDSKEDNIIKARVSNNRQESFVVKGSNCMPPHEVNYDVYPTKLIKLVEKKKWEDAIQRCVEKPEEASTWMCRLQEVDGKGKKKNELRWRILPIHSAIVLHAPVEVIEALVDAYPDGIKTGDDRQMLPLHMAFRLGANTETAAVLVDAYPDALTKKDSKGHTPLHVLKAYRRKYEKERKEGKKSNSVIDENRKELIQFYLGNRRYKKYSSGTMSQDDRTVEGRLPHYNSDSDQDSYISSNASSEAEYLFHKDMFSDFGRLTVEGLNSLPVVLRDTMICR